MSQSINKSLWKHPFSKATRLDAFRRHVARKYNIPLDTYNDLHNWSVTNIQAFNAELWEYCGVVYSVRPTNVGNGLDRMWPPPQWFPGARLNYTENILATGLAMHPDAIAISACREGGTQWRHMTWVELQDQVRLYASALAKAGVRPEDRVATVATNSVEAVVLLLATGWLGAVFSSIAPDMGVNGIVERFVQIRAKVLFVESKVLYATKSLDLRPTLNEAIKELEKRTGEKHTVIDISGQAWSERNVVSLQEFLNVDVEPIPPAQVPFDHPIYILYSSGTTGAPKCICHAGGRALLQQKKEYIFSADIGPDSTYFQYTTTGWMMWNYLVGALSTGARILLYDGSPLHPSPESQIRMLRDQNVTHWGTSPKFLSALRQSAKMKQQGLNNLRYIICAGASLSREMAEWVYTWVPEHVGLFSNSGGTDLVGTIVGGHPLATIHAGELAAAQLGMKVEILHHSGNVVPSGETGELIITEPFLSMPVTFWGANGLEKYRAAYFENVPGRCIWSHGDLIKRNPSTGGYEILGRSDGVLNPGGVRFGTSEIYAILDTYSSIIEDYIAVGQRRATDADEQVLLFLKLRHGHTLENSLRDKIALNIKKELSARHVPTYILQVRDIPYTANGKRIENLVRNIVNGWDVKVGGTAVNPECLEEYRQFTELPRVKETGGVRTKL